MIKQFEVLVLPTKRTNLSDPIRVSPPLPSKLKAHLGRTPCVPSFNLCSSMVDFSSPTFDVRTEEPRRGLRLRRGTWCRAAEHVRSRKRVYTSPAKPQGSIRPPIGWALTNPQRALQSGWPPSPRPTGFWDRSTDEGTQGTSSWTEKKDCPISVGGPEKKEQMIGMVNQHWVHNIHHAYTVNHV